MLSTSFKCSPMRVPVRRSKSSGTRSAAQRAAAQRYCPSCVCSAPGRSPRSPRGRPASPSQVAFGSSPASRQCREEVSRAEPRGGSGTLAPAGTRRRPLNASLANGPGAQGPSGGGEGGALSARAAERGAALRRSQCAPRECEPRRAAGQHPGGLGCNRAADWRQRTHNVSERVEGSDAYAVIAGTLTVTIKGQTITRTGTLAYTFSKHGAEWKIDAQAWGRTS
jgi:hypothetical protein